MSEPAVLPDEPEPRGTVKTYIEGYGYVLVFGRRKEDEQRAEMAGDMFAAYEENEGRRLMTGLHGTVSVHVNHGADPKKAPTVTCTTNLVDSRRKRP